MVGWHHQLNGHELEQTLGERVKDREVGIISVHGITKESELLSNNKMKSTHFNF